MGVLVKDRKHIAHNYFRGHFWFDFIPFLTVLYDLAIWDTTSRVW